MQRVVLVHSLAHCITALKVAKPLQLSVALLTAPHLAGSAGSLYIKKMHDAAAQVVPDVEFRFIVDCGADAGFFFAALRSGLSHIRASASPEVMEKLRAIAQAEGATLHESPTEALDMLDLHAPEAKLVAWLRHDSFG